MYVGVVARHSKVSEEGDDRDCLAPVVAILSDHHPYLGHVLRNFMKYRGITLRKVIVQWVLLNVQSVLKSDFCRY